MATYKQHHAGKLVRATFGRWPRTSHSARWPGRRWPGLADGFWGYINLSALGLLTVSSLIGIRLALPLTGKIPDKLHARIYILLLVVVLLELGVRDGWGKGPAPMEDRT